MGPIETSLRKKLSLKLNPEILELHNDSLSHSGHAGAKEHLAKMENAHNTFPESHFSLTIKSSLLDNLSRVEKQRKIFDIIEEEMKYIHAFAIKIIP